MLGWRTRAQGQAGAALVATALSLCGMQAASAADARSIPFEKAFPVRTEPASLHYRVEYEDAKGTHQLEVWRDGQQRLRRSTDGVLDLFARQRADDLHITLRDPRRQLLTEVSRESLYRVGHGLDWFSLAHGLSRPSTAFSVQALARARAATDMPASAPACRWYKISGTANSGAPTLHDVCWSASLGLPVMIVNQPSGHAVWRLVASDTRRFEPHVFDIDATGFVRVNADQDILAD